MANELINIEVLNLNNDKVKAWVEKKIKEVGHLTVKKVETLPETDIDPLCIYFVPAKKAGTYDEYMYIDNQWELIGSSDVDLEDYYKKSETDDAIDTAIGEHNESELSHSDIRELIQDNVDAIGDLSVLKTTEKDSAVDAVNSVYDKQTKSITMSEDGVNMVFTKNDDTTVEFPLRSVIDETELTGLADVDADGIEDGQYLKYDAESKKFVPETVDNESQYNASKAYTDERIEEVALPTPESKDKLLLSVENEETSELEWSQVDKSTVGDSPFIGTEEEWEALSLEEKAKYKIVNFLDDDGSGKFIEIGENENGFYKKWANGILEQWGHLGKTATGYQTGTKTLPMSFINNDYITILSASYAGNSYVPCVTAQSNDSFNYYNLANGSGLASYYVIGKWK